MSQSVSLLKIDASDKTKIQRWILSRLGGAGIGKKKKGDSNLWYGRT